MRILMAMSVLALVGGCAVEGLHWATPKTQFSYGVTGVKFTDTKDNDISIKDAGIDPNDPSRFHLGELTIRNNASDVRRANVEQMEAVTAQTQLITSAMTQMTADIAKIVELLVAVPVAPEVVVDVAP